MKIQSKIRNTVEITCFSNPIFYLYQQGVLHGLKTVISGYLDVFCQ